MNYSFVSSFNPVAHTSLVKAMNRIISLRSQQVCKRNLLISLDEKKIGCKFDSIFLSTVFVQSCFFALLDVIFGWLKFCSDTRSLNFEFLQSLHILHWQRMYVLPAAYLIPFELPLFLLFVLYSLGPLFKTANTCI